MKPSEMKYLDKNANQRFDGYGKEIKRLGP
jgi:hypothetical protein